MLEWLSHGDGLTIRKQSRFRHRRAALFTGPLHIFLQSTSPDSYFQTQYLSWMVVHRSVIYICRGKERCFFLSFSEFYLFLILSPSTLITYFPFSITYFSLFLSYFYYISKVQNVERLAQKWANYGLLFVFKNSWRKPLH